MYHVGIISILALICAHLTVLSNCQVPPKSNTNDGDYNTLHRDGSYEFGYNNNDDGASYHLSQANRANVVRGRFGARDPSTGGIKETIYTAGPRGFRARGPNIHRKMDLDQRPRGPIGNKDDPYFDPNEDPSYSFGFKTPTYGKQETANRLGDVSGRYSYVDDVGERHNVEYIAGKNTGFHVKSAYPDSSPGSIGPLYFNGPLVRGEKKPRGHTSIQRGLDGSYRFISAGPDQRRTESSDANGNVRGSYTFLDDKGVQRTVHYIAGPGIGYRVVKNSKDPFVPTFFPNLPDYRDPDLNKPFVPPTDDFPPTFPNKGDGFDDDVFGGPGGSAASGHVKPPANGNRKPGTQGNRNDNDDKNDVFDKDFGSDFGTNDDRKPDSDLRPTLKPTPSIDSDFSGQEEGKPTIYGENGDDDDIFGKPSIINRPINGNNNIRPDTGGIGGSGSDLDNDDDIFGPRPTKPITSGGSISPTKPGGGTRPSYGGGRPDNKPGGGRPSYGGGRPNNKPGGGTRPSYGGGRPDSNRPGNGDISKPISGTRPGDGESGGIGGGDGSGIDGETGANGDHGNNGGTGVSGGSGTNVRPGPSQVKPGNGFRPGTSERPGYNKRPGTNGFRPDIKDKPENENRPGPGSNNKPGVITRPGNGFDDISTDDDLFSGSNKPGSIGSDNKKPGSGGSFIDKDDDDDIFGPKPISTDEAGGSGSSDKGPGGKPDSSGSSGFNKKPGSTDSNQSNGGSVISKPTRPRPTKPIGPIGGSGQSGTGTSTSGGGGFLDEDENYDTGSYGGVQSGQAGGNKQDGSGGSHVSGGTQITFTGHKDKHRGGTIFTNLGDKSISFPPGASVRAHVQSIDLLPFGTKTQSPSEAVEEELKKHGSR